MSFRHRLTSFGRGHRHPILVAVAACGVASAAQAQVAGGRALYGVQPVTGKIVTINPLTGSVGVGFAAPGDLVASNTAIGLSGAESGNVLIYRDSNSTTSGNTLFRLNPNTGAVLSSFTADGFTSDGLTYENNGSDRIFSSHSGADVHFQNGYGGPTTFFYAPGATVGALGGDGLGRDFGNFTDGTIKEFNGSTGTSSAILNSFAAPATTVQGLAYDGVNLFASTSTGLLYTLNPNTGAILNTVTVQNGALFGLGIAGSVPEPATLGGAVACVAIAAARRSRRPA